MINKDRLKNICTDIGVELDAQALERFELFASMLVEKNKVLNLTAITDPERLPSSTLRTVSLRFA